MPTELIIEFLPVVHKGNNAFGMAFPDVCLTPGPPAPPLPIPYPNFAQSADLADGSSTVKADGNPIMLASSKFSRSTGDEPGVNGGVMSGVTRGAALPITHSSTVKIEGQFVVRLLDLSVQNANGGGTANTPPTPLIVPPAGGGLLKQLKKKLFGSKDIAFDKGEAWCGDEVKIEENFKEPPGAKVVVNLFREGEEPLHEAVVLPASGTRAEGKWITRRGSYKETVKIIARRPNPGDKPVESSPLTVKAPAKVAKESVGPKKRVTPQWKKDNGTKTWMKTGKNYEWEFFYEIELKPGELVVTRPVAFELMDGCAAPSAVKLKEWEAEIAAVWDKMWRFHRKDCKRGNGCSCGTASGCCNILLRVVPELGANRGGTKKVELHKGANDPNDWGGAKWWYSHTWWEAGAGVPATVRAHEFGHLVGMYDEYPEGACDPARKYTNEAGSIMNDGSMTFERHIQEWHEWLDNKLSAFGKTVALRVE